MEKLLVLPGWPSRLAGGCLKIGEGTLIGAMTSRKRHFSLSFTAQPLVSSIMWRAEWLLPIAAWDSWCSTVPLDGGATPRIPLETLCC
jgi:hypothetical protein